MEAGTSTWWVATHTRSCCELAPGTFAWSCLVPPADPCFHRRHPPIPTATSYPLPTATHTVPTATDSLPATSHPLPTATHSLPATSYPLPTATQTLSSAPFPAAVSAHCTGEGVRRRRLRSKPGSAADRPCLCLCA